MRFLRYFCPLVAVGVSTSLALSDQANDVLDHISDLSKTLHENQETVDRYNGGLVAASSLASGVYNTWGSLRSANADLKGTTKFTPDDSTAIVHSLASANEESIGLFDAYQQKAPMLIQAGVGFMVPLIMEALYREADDYMVSLKNQMPAEYLAQMDGITAKHTKAWRATFAAYEPSSNPKESDQHSKFFSMVSPVLGLLV